MRRHLWLAVVITVLIIAAMAVTATTRRSAAKAGPARAAAQVTARYACPMHPEVTSATRDRCPKCGMYLERVVKHWAGARRWDFVEGRKATAPGKK